jgi:hypothetical protein
MPREHHGKASRRMTEEAERRGQGTRREPSECLDSILARVGLRNEWDVRWDPPVSSTKEGECELGQPMDNGPTDCDCSWAEQRFESRKGT